ncbi:MAG: ATPase, T2SS/T4P/T4SS family [Clostridia bacterium]
MSENNLYEMIEEMDNQKQIFESDNNNYQNLLNNLRSWLSDNYRDELLRILDSESAKNSLKDLILIFLKEQEGYFYIKNANHLVQKMFDDLVGFAFLEKYIYRDDIEEINGNSWEDIEIITNSGWERTKEKFVSVQHAQDIVKKMMRLGGVVLDEKMPLGDSYISSGIRISAMIPPVVDEKTGVVFSLRKQKAKVFSKNEFIKLGTYSDEQFEFLTMCLNHRISVGIAGGTSSGKTSDISSLIASLRNAKRVFVIEDTRETFIEPNLNKRIIYTKTRASENKNRKITATKLLKMALRYHPDIIVPAEIRDEAALMAIEAGRTGHAILTGLHANSSIQAYDRILSLCMMSKTNMKEALLMKLIIAAFPIMVYKAQLSDGSRKVLEIFEAEKYDDVACEVVGKVIFRYKIKNIIKDKTGKIKKIEGEHLKVNSISRKLANHLYKYGSKKEVINKFANKGWIDE